MLGRQDDTGFAAYQQARARADDRSKVVEKRETDEEVLLIFQDFVSYKANLAATRGVESG